MKMFLNASEVAKLVQVDRATVTRWIKKGTLAANRFGGPRWRISFTSYAKLVKKKNENR